MLREAGYYARMVLGLYRLVRTPPASDPDGEIRSQLENRERIFLDTVRRVIFANPENPYHRMFKMTGCRLEDLAEEVRRHGLETTLAAIHRQGVYLTHDEIKGKKPIVRSGEGIPSDESSFLNPLASGLMESASSGSRSKGTRTRQSTRNQVYRENYEVLIRREFGLAARAEIQVKPILPAAWGVGGCIRSHRLGGRVERWFTAGGTWRDSGHYRAVTNGLALEARLLGVPMPFPTYLPPNDFSPVAEWIARRRARGVACWVSAIASSAARVAAAALEKGLDIRGTVFQASGEALTEAKRAVIEAAGSEVFSYYHINEVGPIGQGCRQMRTGNRVHVYRDSVAVISHRRRAPLSDAEVNSLLFTTLLPFAPRILINAEMDDAGVIEPARCDCVFARTGFTEQVSGIYSYGKLTGQGTTLVGSDLVRILEEVLPARFGGGPTDYQLVEQEGQAQTQITLRVSPRARAGSREEVQDYFLHQVRGLYGGSLTCRDWRHSGGVQVVIGEPFLTSSGKILSLHLLGPGSDAHGP